MDASTENYSSREFGREIYDLIQSLYPICRSITGDGSRKTLHLLRKYIPLEIHEVPTGTQVFDWTIPKEWNIRDAYVKNAAGHKIIDFSKSNLHVLNYSTPIHQKVNLRELKEHLFTLPDHPDWIPYRTSYYNENWGFCLSYNQYLTLQEETYEVFIDSSLEAGHLTYGEFFIPGKASDEVIISCHICHPSLCNDNLSGVSIAVALAQHLSQLAPYYSYRFLFIPGTIGSITWLALNEAKTENIKHGLVLTCLGDTADFTYKRSRQGDAEIDRIIAYALSTMTNHSRIIEFSPYGYDERQYCSPGFNLPVGCFMRSPHGTFPEYHTSADNLDFVRSDKLEESFFLILSILKILENNHTYLNLKPKCEPQLGKRGLYRMIGGHQDSENYQMAMLWVLNLSDGHYCLLDIAECSGIRFSVIQEAAQALKNSGLLKEL
jgi:aminopeptidase-like protein